MSEIIVRRATRQDFKAVQEIHLAGGIEMLTNGGPMEIADMELHIGDENGIFGVAEIEGEIVGFIYGEKLIDRWAFAHYFAVRPDYRGSTVFKHLGEYFIDQSKSRGAKYIFGYANSNNERLINFYKRFGFTAGGTYTELIKEI